MIRLNLAKRRTISLVAITVLLVLLPLVAAFKVPDNPGDDFAFDSTRRCQATRHTIRETNRQIASTGAQVMVAMILTLGTSIGCRAEIFRTWGIGSRDKKTASCCWSPKRSQTADRSRLRQAPSLMRRRVASSRDIIAPR